MKYLYIYCFLFTSTFTHIFAGERMQNKEEQTQNMIKPLPDAEIKESKEDKKTPFILICEDDVICLLPDCIRRGINDSLIYTFSKNKESIAFCPSNEMLTGELKNCLIPSKSNFCKNSVEPEIVPNFKKKEEQSNCANGRSKLYTFGFQPCNYLADDLGGGDENLRPLRRKTIYKFCYDHKTEQVLYIFRKMISPKLLESPLLEEERKATYTLRTNDFNLFNNRFEKMKSFFSEENLAKSGQVMQYIVPPEDMAFRNWKKAAYHFINVKPVLNKTANLLNHVNQYLRHAAIDRLGEIFITDGFQLSYSLEVNIWWKIVYSETLNSSIAFVVHNTDNQPSPREKLCAKSICKKCNWKELIPEDMSSYAYCCSSEDIARSNDLPIVPHPLNLGKWWKKFMKSKYHRRRLFC